MELEGRRHTKAPTRPDMRPPKSGVSVGPERVGGGRYSLTLRAIGYNRSAADPLHLLSAQTFSLLPSLCE